jgi:hypothetical protein
MDFAAESAHCEVRDIFIGLGNCIAILGRFSRLFLDGFAVKFRRTLDGFLQN